MTHTSLLESHCVLQSAEFLRISKGVCGDEATYTLLPQSPGDPTSATFLLKYALLAKSFKQYIVNNLVNDPQCLKTFTGLCFCNLVMFHILGATTHQTYLLYSQALTQTELCSPQEKRDKGPESVGKYLRNKNVLMRKPRCRETEVMPSLERCLT